VSGDDKRNDISLFDFGKLAQAVEDLLDDIKIVFKWKDKIEDKDLVDQKKCDAKSLELKKGLIDPTKFGKLVGRVNGLVWIYAITLFVVFVQAVAWFWKSF